MRRAADQAIEHYLSAPTFHIGPGKTKLFETVFPLAAHAVNQVRAALLLADHGYAFPGQANARSAVEHAITVQWMLLTHDGHSRVAAELLRHYKAVLNGARNFTDLEGVGDGLPDVKSEGPARSFERMCLRFDESRSLYVMHRRLSESVHPSLGTITEYLDHGDEEVSALSLEPKSEPDVDFIWACALSAVFAVSALETLRRGRPFKAKIRKIAEVAHARCLPRRAARIGQTRSDVYSQGAAVRALASVRAGQDAPTRAYPASVLNPNNGVIAARGAKG
jgi:hypothetical protein